MLDLDEYPFNWSSIHSSAFRCLGLTCLQMQETEGMQVWIPGSGRSLGGENGNPLQNSCLENPMSRGVWWATVHRVSKSQTRLNRFKAQHKVFIVRYSYDASCQKKKKCVPLYCRNSRVSLFYITETLYLWSLTSSFSSPPSPSNYHFNFYFCEFEYLDSTCNWNHEVFVFLISV